MPGKRARRHFSQLSEFERGRIIGMKTAGWSTRRVAGQVDRSKHLAEANLKSKRPFRAIPLTPEHRQLRVQWCQARSMWNVTDWQKVVFCDESRIVFGIDDNRVRGGGALVSGTIPHPVLHHTARTAGVMVWGP
ncbi:transposable element Tc1 transposase [Trichonephila clavipes]|nr:transposable element Tc1 transposase [Trichonephila clavipes]